MSSVLKFLIPLLFLFFKAGLPRNSSSTNQAWQSDFNFQNNDSPQVFALDELEESSPNQVWHLSDFNISTYAIPLEIQNELAVNGLEIGGNAQYDVDEYQMVNWLLYNIRNSALFNDDNLDDVSFYDRPEAQEFLNFINNLVCNGEINA